MSPANNADLPEVQDAALQHARDVSTAAQALLEAVLRQTEEVAGDLPPELLTQLQLTWRPGTTAAQLHDQLQRALRQAVAQQAAVRPGRIYCYACASAGCEHALPNEPNQVFAGYTNLGQPRWLALPNYLLELDDERVDRLFAARPPALARVVPRDDLVAEQTSAYGRDSATYRLLGQLVAGLYSVNRTRCALTAQIVADAAGELHLQTVMPDALRDALHDTPRRRPSAMNRVYDALRKLRRQVADLALLKLDSPDELEARALVLLRRLAASLEQKGRQGQRRTHHAEERLLDRRPVFQATGDLDTAPDEAFMRDTVRHSIVVMGRGGRSHVYNADGRHITTFHLPAPKLERRQRSRRYVPLERDEIAALKAAVASYQPEQEK